MARNILTSSIENATIGIIFQIAFRFITFFLNRYTIKSVDQNVLGIINVRLLLLESGILFLSKESIRKVCLTNSRSHNWAKVINLIWMSVPVCVVVSSFLVYIWIYIWSTEEIKKILNDNNYQYILACISIGVSCVIEQCTQSAVLVAQSFCFVRLKIAIEAIYILSRTLIFVYLISKYHTKTENWAINAFSVAQILSTIIMCALYYGFFLWYIPKLNKFKLERNTPNNRRKKSMLFSDVMHFPFRSILNLFPGSMHNEDRAKDKNLKVLITSFGIQSVTTYVLTQGERYVMTAFTTSISFKEQSDYDIVNNLGSLAARLIFRPIEESAYFYFSQTIKRDTLLVKQKTKNITEAAEVLSQLCKIATSIGLIVVIFGPSYSYTLLYLYGGENLVTNKDNKDSKTLAITLLQFHCIAIVLLAINGVTEAYVAATMHKQQLNTYNCRMIIFSMIFLIFSYMLTASLGANGFIVANCFNMGARIIHSLHFIYHKYKETSYKPLKGLIPSRKFGISLIISGIVTIYSEGVIRPESILLHISFGAIFFLITIFVWCMENRFVLDYYEQWRNPESNGNKVLQECENRDSKRKKKRNKKKKNRKKNRKK